MADVPISNALIDSAQFQVQSVAPATPGSGLVRLFRGPDGWGEMDDSGAVNVFGPLVPIMSILPFSITSGELLDLVATPKIIVPNSDPNVLVLPQVLIIRYVPGGNPYSASGSFNVGNVLVGGNYSFQSLNMSVVLGGVYTISVMRVENVGAGLTTEESFGLPLVLFGDSSGVSGGNGHIDGVVHYSLFRR